MPRKPILVAMPTETGKVFMLPLRPEPVAKPKPDTEYPALPFLREHDLKDECIELLKTESERYGNHDGVPHFGIIPAIKHVRVVMGWDLKTSKEYVDKIYENNACQIDAVRVECISKWKAKHS